MKRLLLGLLFTLTMTVLSFGQESKLANEYYVNGEYEKAAVLYKRLFESSNNSDYYFQRFIDCLTAVEAYEEAEDFIEKTLRKNPDQVQLYVTLGNLYDLQFRDEEAQEQYDKAIKKLPADRMTIIRLAQAFTNLTKYEEAIAVYEKGAKLLKDEEIFSYNLGDLYRLKDDTPKMIEAYLTSLDANPGRLNSLQTLFQRYLAEEGFNELQAQLYSRMQENRDAVYYPELLAWVFIQRKDYRSALRQAKALDKRLNENGTRVYDLAEIAANDKDYDVAIAAYDYIVAEKGAISTFYIQAKQKSLRCKRLKITETYDYTQEDIRALEREYQRFLDEFGRRKNTAPILFELAELEAFYLNDLDQAIQILNELIELPGIDSQLQAEGKLSLADFYLMKGDVWEATLLYSQVDKAFPDDIMGHEARYRNARLSYFAGDFEWAQVQFEVLKASTSKLIANDALDLSVFIMDNLGLDTTAASLKLYSDAELLTFQNRLDEAFNKLDTLTERYPEHSLKDDVYYAKAQIFLKQREYVKAADMFQRIIEEHNEEIRADNALFELAQLYETHLNDLEKAKSLYETLFIDYSGSTFAVEARKRFRKLRGDDM